jgi:glutaredoxin 3
MTQHSAVTMYTTEVCRYCLRAKALLKARGVTAIEEVRVDRDPVARIAMIERTGRRTVPQIFIAGAHIGGCDDLIELDQRGGLLPLLQPQAAPG